jgi:ATP-binding cassette subfamily B protein
MTVLGGIERMFRGFVQLLSLVKPYSGHLLRVLMLQALILLFTVPQPWLIKHLIDKGAVYENYPVAATIAALIILIVLTGILFFLAEYSLLVIANTICYHLRRGFYNHVQSMSYSFFDQWRVGDLFARYKEVSVALPQVLIGVGASLGDLLAALVYGGLIVYINPPISLMIVIAAAASTALMVPLARMLHRSVRSRARQIGKVAGIVIEFLSGMKVIQAMRAEAVSEARLKQALEELKHHEIRSGLLRLIMMTANRVMGSILIIVCIWYALGMVQREELTLGTLTAVLALLSYLSLTVRRLLELLGRVQIAVIDLERYTPKSWECLPPSSPPKARCPARGFRGISN